MSVRGDNRTIEQLIKQLYKLINIINVQNVTHLPCVERELMLIKINLSNKERSMVLDVVNIFRAKVVDISLNYLILEVTGDPGKIFAIQQLLGQYKITEIARTGKIALVRESNINTEVLKKTLESSSSPNYL